MKVEADWTDVFRSCNQIAQWRLYMTKTERGREAQGKVVPLVSGRRGLWRGTGNEQ